MGVAKQRRIDARANRQASMTVRYGTPETVKLPPPKSFPSKEAIVAVAKKMPEVVEKRGRGRPPGTRNLNMDKNQTKAISSVKRKTKAGTAIKGKKNGK